MSACEPVTVYSSGMPRGGEVVEVRYLYAGRGGGLQQPVYLGPRHDLDPATACRADQLTSKAEPSRCGGGDGSEDADAGD